MMFATAATVLKRVPSKEKKSLNVPSAAAAANASAISAALRKDMLASY